MINLDNHGNPPKKSISLSFGGYSSGTWSYPSILTGVTGCIRCGSPSTTILVKLSAHERWYECKKQSCTVRYYKTIIATGESKIVELKDAAVNAKTTKPSAAKAFLWKPSRMFDSSTIIYKLRPKVDMSDLANSEELVNLIKYAATLPQACLVLKDGRRELGAIYYFERVGRGHLIDFDRKFSLDFSLSEVETIEY